MTALEQAIEMEKGKVPECSCELAQLYLAEGYARKAIEVLRCAKDENPDDLRVSVALGDAHFGDEQYAEAVREDREALEEVPDPEIARTAGQGSAGRRTNGRGGAGCTWM